MGIIKTPPLKEGVKWGISEAEPWIPLIPPFTKTRPKLYIMNMLSKHLLDEKKRQLTQYPRLINMCPPDLSHRPTNHIVAPYNKPRRKMNIIHQF